MLDTTQSGSEGTHAVAPPSGARYGISGRSRADAGAGAVVPGDVPAPGLPPRTVDEIRFATAASPGRPLGKTPVDTTRFLPRRTTTMFVRTEAPTARMRKRVALPRRSATRSPDGRTASAKARAPDLVVITRVVRVSVPPVTV